jgi:hypothetical protein
MFQRQMSNYCHNPTNNPKQLKTTFVGVVLLSVKNPPPHHHTTPHHTTPQCDYTSGSSRQPSKLIFGMQPYSNPTRTNMEDDLNTLENGRQPQISSKEKDLIFLENGKRPKTKLSNQKQLKVKTIVFLKWKTTEIFLSKKEDNSIILIMEDYHKKT